jgi:hypothetical protein
MAVHTRPLRVLLFQELPGRWSARSLEHDLAVEGRTLEGVLDHILQLIFAHIDFDRRHGRLPLSAFPMAPRRFWDAYKKAKPLHSVSRHSADPQQSYGPILISVSEERPSISRPLRVTRTDRRLLVSDRPADRVMSTPRRVAR